MFMKTESASVFPIHSNLNRETGPLRQRRGFGVERFGLRLLFEAISIDK